LDLKAIFEPDESPTINAAESCPAVEDRKAVDMPTLVEAVVSGQFNDAGQDVAAAAARRPRSAIPVPVPWPAAADFCLSLTVDDLPPVPFRLNAWTEVSDAAKMLRWLQADIRRGPSGPRAFYGALQADLLALQWFALRASDCGVFASSQSMANENVG
jgi:hypothetical protein